MRPVSRSIMNSSIFPRSSPAELRTLSPLSVPAERTRGCSITFFIALPPPCVCGGPPPRGWKFRPAVRRAGRYEPNLFVRLASAPSSGGAVGVAALAVRRVASGGLHFRAGFAAELAPLALDAGLLTATTAMLTGHRDLPLEEGVSKAPASGSASRDPARFLHENGARRAT